jgi:hypothetical protein
MFTDDDGTWWYSPKEAAEYINKFGGNATVATLATMRTNGGGPPFIRSGRRVHYLLIGLAAWIKAKKSSLVTSTSELRRPKGE